MVNNKRDGLVVYQGGGQYSDGPEPESAPDKTAVDTRGPKTTTRVWGSAQR
jgi:hypothetical protein